MNKFFLKTLGLFVAFTIGLTGCGGGGDVSEPLPITKPPSNQNDSVLAEVESNNSKEQSNLLPIGTTIRGAINKAGDIDWFKIQSSGGNYTISAGVDGVYSPISGGRWIVTVYGEDNREVTSFDIDQRYPVSVNVNLPTPGNYYISTKYYYATIENNNYYYLAIAAKKDNDFALAEVESNNSKEQSNLLPIGTTIRGAINKAGDIDWFKIQSSGGNYTISAGVDGVYSPISGGRWIVTVYGEDNREVTSFDIDQRYPVSVNVNLPTPGNYYISTKYYYATIENNNYYYLAIIRN